MVRLAIAANEGGRFSNAARFAAIDGGTIPKPLGSKDIRDNPITITSNLRKKNLLLDIPIDLL
jgi:putative cofactor-binding repeat protein